MSGKHPAFVVSVSYVNHSLTCLVSVLRPVTAADLLSIVTEEPTSSFVALQTAHNSILHRKRGLKHRRMCVLFCVRISVCACAQDLPTYTVFPALVLPLTLEEYIRFKVYTRGFFQEPSIKTSSSLPNMLFGPLKDQTKK